MKYGVLLLMISLSMMSFAYANPYSFNLHEDPLEVNITNTTIINTNHSNSTDYWITGDYGSLRNVIDISHSWLDDLFWSTSGHIIDTVLDMNGNDIEDVKDINITGDLEVGNDTFFSSGINYFLTPEINGSFKTNITDGKFIYWRVENGNYIKKAEIGDSIITDRVILDGIHPQLFTTIDEDEFDNPLANLVRQNTYGVGVEVGNWYDDSYINTEENLFIQRKEANIFGVNQPIANETKTGTEFFYNFTTPSAAQGFFFSGAINLKQDYILEENYSGVIYTEIYDIQQSLIAPIWESSSYFDFTQGRAGYLELVENTTVYRDQFDSGVTLLSNKTYLIKTYFNQSVTVNGTTINGVFVPWIRGTAILFNTFKVAIYEFEDNNFNGTGNITLGDKLIFKFGEMIDNLVDGWLRITGSVNITDSLNIQENLTVNGISNFNRKMVKLKKTDNQTIFNSGTWNNITFNLEEFDTGNMFNNASNNYTININRSGLYSLTYHIKLESQDKTSFESRTLINGEIYNPGCDTAIGSKISSYITLQNSYNLIELNASDEIMLQISHDEVGSILLHGIDSYLQVVEEFY